MYRFLHSADWQLGARFSQFGARGAKLRAARLTTLKKVLDLARTEAVDAFFVAGDLFEDNQVDDALVTTVVDLFSDYPTLPIFVLPGNHDPFTGPDSVWQRRTWLKVPSHVRVLTEPGVTPLAPDVFLLASPLQQKLSTLDPSLKLVALASALPSTAIKIGLTHGALAIEGKHQPNDFPIALNAATRAGLDYLGLGHWHNWLSETDGGRIVMPGTPEPDRFGNDRAGNVALVEIEAPGHLPRVRAIPVAYVEWHPLTFDFANAMASRSSLEQIFARLSPHPERTVVRVTMTGTVSPQPLTETNAWLDEKLAPFLVGQKQDRTALALTGAELDDLGRRHPLLTQILADVDRMELLATGQSSAAAAQPSSVSPLTLAEAQFVLAPSKIELSRLTVSDFAQLRQHLLRTLQEIAP